MERAGAPSSDYELWSPSDGRADGNKCLLGHQVRYTRRRRAAQCFNGQQYERAEFRKNCPCAEEDYECDFGYERSSDTGPCVAIMAMPTSICCGCSPDLLVTHEAFSAMMRASSSLYLAKARRPETSRRVALYSSGATPHRHPPTAM